MTEFKVSQGLKSEIEALRAAGESINATYTQLPTEDVCSLITCMRYAEQHEKIKKLMALYGELLEKDAADLEAMMTSVQNADKTASSQMK